MEYLIDHGAKVDAQDDGMQYTSGCKLIREFFTLKIYFHLILGLEVLNH